MRLFPKLLLGIGALACNLLAASIGVQAETLGVTPSGDTSGRYTFTLIDFFFVENQEIEIRFSPTVFLTLSAPVAPPEYDVLVLQPDNPPGFAGIYSLLALVDGASLDGPFTLGFTVKGNAPIPLNLPFTYNQFKIEDGELVFDRKISEGRTFATGVIPEPGSFGLVGGLVAVAGAAAALRRRYL